MTFSSALPSVLVVHGVGIAATSFDTVTDLLSRRSITAVAVERRGYDGRPASPSLETHIGDVLDRIDDEPGRVVVAGVSGGATIALGTALTGHPRLVGAVVHEPLIGPLAPSQHEHITNSIRTMLDDHGGTAVDEFLERLLTPRMWVSLAPQLRAQAQDRRYIVRIESPGFADFTVEPAELQAARTPTTWTVGRHSPGWRHAAADVARASGLDVRILDAAHTPQIEDPDGFADVVASVALASAAQGRR